MNYAKIAGVAAVLGVAITLSACGGGGNNNDNNKGNGSAGQVQQVNPAHVARNEMSSHSLQINMGAQSNSGQSGSASVADAKGGGITVTVDLKGEPKGASEPSHIHKGTCAKLDPAPWKPLSSVVNGKAVSHVPGVTVAEIKKGKYAINVHKSANDLKTYVSCGDLTL